MIKYIKTHKALVTFLVLLVLTMVFNQPESETNGVSLLIFMASLFSGFVAIFSVANDEFKN